MYCMSPGRSSTVPHWLSSLVSEWIAASSRGHSSTFADGFEHPLGLAVEPHGGLLAGDWGRGVIYLIRKR